MKRFVFLIGGLIAAFIMLLSSVRLVGAHTVSLVTAVLESTRCTPSCWHNIHPGITTLDQAQILFASDDDWQPLAHDWPITYRWALKSSEGWQSLAIRDYSANTSIIAEIELIPPDGALRVGDAIREFGDPIGVRVCAKPNSHAHLYFKNHIEVVAVDREHGTIERLDPQLAVEYIFFHDPASASPTYTAADPWQGFMDMPSMDAC